MISLQASTDGMMELLYGDKPASLLHALRVASLSVLQNLEVNGKMSRLLAPFVNRPLPDRETLTALLRLSHGVIFGSHLDALASIDEAWLNGKISKFETVPVSYEEQVTWRSELVSLIHGMSYKTVSFALLIYSPLACQLVPVDRHHLRRLAQNPNRTPTGKQYIAIELALQAERDEHGYKNLPLGTWASWKWAEQRDGVDAESYPSHRALSCRWY